MKIKYDFIEVSGMENFEPENGINYCRAIITKGKKEIVLPDLFKYDKGRERFTYDSEKKLQEYIKMFEKKK
jgi:hypothetical protein